MRRRTFLKLVAAAMAGPSNIPAITAPFPAITVMELARQKQRMAMRELADLFEDSLWTHYTQNPNPQLIWTWVGSDPFKWE